MATIIYKVKVAFTKGEASDVHFADLKKNVKERLTRDLPARKGEAIAELVSITEE